jgi:radical SAM protein with 4Fe4S-binding SPASM domain
MNSKTFCILPWLHFYANPDGSVIPCCIADHHLHLGNLRQNSIEEIWNNDRFKNIRKKMMNGQKCDECKACYISEETGNFSSRQYYNEKFKKYLNLVNETDSEGFLNQLKLVYFDIRWSNICNFKCRTCSGTYSSSWALEDIKHGRNRKVHILAGGDNNDDLYEQLSPHFKDMEEIYFAGGEPLLTDKHFEMLEFLIDNNLTDIELRYNTNLSMLTYKNKSVLEYWSNFKKINVYVSLDSWGTRAEYIREGTEWDIIISNIRSIKENLSHVNLQSHSVISCFNVYTFTDFIDYLLDSNLFLENTFFPTTYNLINPYYYSFSILDDDIKQLIKKKLQSKKYNDHINQQIETIIHALDNSIYDLNHRKTFINMTDYYDRIRNKDFKKTFPELNSLYEFR